MKKPKARTPQQEFAFLIHYAKVLLMEARRFRISGHRNFSATLLKWAAGTRMEAAEIKRGGAEAQGPQLDLFKGRAP